MTQSERGDLAHSPLLPRINASPKLFLSCEEHDEHVYDDRSRRAYLPIDVLLGLLERDVHETVKTCELSCCEDGLAVHDKTKDPAATHLDT